MTMSTKTYSELITIPTFEERFQYLQLKGSVGKDTFGYDRYLNQVLYSSPEWKRLRNQIIIRDGACDLACEGYDIHGRILIHHLNPITVDDVLARSRKVFDPDNLVCVTHNTHNAIHYGDANLLVTGPIIRTKNDTCPWRHE
jgi:hypothetical protein